jgi:hypothetical protein
MQNVISLPLVIAQWWNTWLSLRTEVSYPAVVTSGLYCKHITIINYNSIVINKFGASLTDDARVIIYNCHMFIVQTTRDEK